MRELKFRCWGIKENKYLKLHSIHISTSKVIVSYYGVGGGNISKALKDVVLEQFTGLKDKNGKEIYEGDIVEYVTYYYGNEKRHRKVIEWEEWDSDDFGEPHNLGYFNLSEYVEVIGNIHENPELLKGDE